MNTNFIDFCFTNNKYIYIKFNRQMLLKGEHEISNANNYAIEGIQVISSSSPPTVPLKNFISEIYHYGDDFITFKLKENIPVLSNTILFGGYISMSSVFFITDINEYVHDFTCPSTIDFYSDKPSIKNCSAKIVSNKIVILKDNNIIPLSKLCICDLYLINGNSTFFPINIKFNVDGTFTLIFNSEIIRHNDEPIYLCTKSKCISTDRLGNILLPNQCTSTLNSLPTMPINLSIFSYIDDVLGIALEFNDAIMRYDSNDFYFTINDKCYVGKGRLSHNKDNIIYFFIYNVFDFDYINSKVAITYKNPSTPYTLDKNMQPLKSFKIYSNILYGLSAKLDNIDDAQIGFLNIIFNKCLITAKYSVSGYFNKFNELKHKIFSNLILDYVPYLNSINGSLNALYIDDFAIILFHTINDITLSSSTHSIEINSFEKNFICEIDLSNYNFLNLLKDKIDYIEIIPLAGIKSYNYTSPISTLEIPTEFLINDDIELVFKPDEQDKFKELLGSTISAPATILVDKTFENYTYGDAKLQNKIIFTNNLYIKSINALENFKNPIINVINIQGKILYVSLDNNYYINFDNCHFEDVVIL
ncbi:MAG: hypothetical protein ACRCTZ_07210 [Sarcina sp.]